MGVISGGHPLAAEFAPGMPSYELLSDGQLQALRHYIREQAEVELAGGGVD